MGTVTLTRMTRSRMLRTFSLLAMLTEMMLMGRGWSNTYIVRLFATMQQERERISP